MLLQQFKLLFPLCGRHLLLGVWKKYYWQKSNHLSDFIRYFIILQAFYLMRFVLVANLMFKEYTSHLQPYKYILSFILQTFNYVMWIKSI